MISALRRQTAAILRCAQDGVWLQALFAVSYLSQKFDNKVFLVRTGFSEPRQGRQRIAQGASPGLEGPHPAFGTPLPLVRERGGGEGAAC